MKRTSLDKTPLEGSELEEDGTPPSDRKEEQESEDVEEKSESEEDDDEDESDDDESGSDSDESLDINLENYFTKDEV